MKRFVDKLGRRINVGDIVCASSSYQTQLRIGKITLITDKAVSLRLYGKEENGRWNDPAAVLSLDILKEEPNSYKRWTNSPQRRLLILVKNKSK